jgi:hypothetical protein
LHRVNPGAVVGKQRVSDMRAANSSSTGRRKSISPSKTISVVMAPENKRYYVV